MIVEGVETDCQADYFSPDPPQIFGQGWLYGRPVSIEQFESLLVENLAATLSAVAQTAKAPSSEDGESDWVTKPGRLQIMGSRVA